MRLSLGMSYNIVNNTYVSIYMGQAVKAKVANNFIIAQASIGSGNIVVSSDRRVTLSIYRNTSGSLADFSAVAYKRLGTNS